MTRKQQLYFALEEFITRVQIFFGLNWCILPLKPIQSKVYSCDRKGFDCEFVPFKLGQMGR